MKVSSLHSHTFRLTQQKTCIKQHLPAGLFVLRSILLKHSYIVMLEWRLFYMFTCFTFLRSAMIACSKACVMFGKKREIIVCKQLDVDRCASVD